MGFKGRRDMPTSSGCHPLVWDSEQVTTCSSIFSITGRFNETTHISLSVQPQGRCSPTISALPPTHPADRQGATQSTAATSVLWHPSSHVTFTEAGRREKPELLITLDRKRCSSRLVGKKDIYLCPSPP